jgi:hypothetical protein
MLLIETDSLPNRHYSDGAVLAQEFASNRLTAPIAVPADVQRLARRGYIVPDSSICILGRWL